MGLAAENGADVECDHGCRFCLAENTAKLDGTLRYIQIELVNRPPGRMPRLRASCPGVAPDAASPGPANAESNQKVLRIGF